jgi:hypothetical protein
MGLAGRLPKLTICQAGGSEELVNVVTESRRVPLNAVNFHARSATR